MYSKSTNFFQLGEHNLAGSESIVPSRQIHSFPIAHRKYDDRYTENTASPSHENNTFVPASIPKYGSAFEANLLYLKRLSGPEEDSTSESLSANNFEQRHHSEDFRQDCELESPLQAYQNHTNQVAVASQELPRAYNASQEGIYQNNNSVECCDIHNGSEFIAKPEYGDSSLLVRPPPQEYSFQPHNFPQHPYQLSLKNFYFQPAEPCRTLPFQSAYQPQVYEYPDLTSIVNSCQEAVGPMAEMMFVDSKICVICGKRITRDMSRHMRTHQKEKRFVCLFPKSSCGKRSSQFNRRYEFKKHLLNEHFVFDNPDIVKRQTLRDKLSHWGSCLCGQRFLAQNWINNHVLTPDKSQQCSLLKSP